MLDSVWDIIRSALGYGDDQPNAAQMAVRAAVTFCVLVFYLRLGDKRLLGKGTAFDNVVAIMIGSVMASAITGTTPVLRTWLAGFVLIGMHWLLALAAFRLDWFGPLVKGNRILLVKDGEIQWDGMREASVTERELKQAIRSSGTEPDPSLVQRASLERDGSISIVPRQEGPKILDVSVENGVQRVRIELQ